MSVINQQRRFHQEWFTGIRELLANSFVKEDAETDAEVIFQKIKHKEFDKKSYIEKIKSLKRDRWEQEYIEKALKEFQEILGTDDTYIKEQSVRDLSDEDLEEVKWNILMKIMVEYSKSSNEFYDLLKYSDNVTNSLEKELLLTEIMHTLKTIHDLTKDVVDRYEHRPYHKKSMEKVAHQKRIVDHLFLRTYNILFNLKDIDLTRQKKILSEERIEKTTTQA